MCALCKEYALASLADLKREINSECGDPQKGPDSWGTPSKVCGAVLVLVLVCVCVCVCVDVDVSVCVWM